MGREDKIIMQKWLLGSKFLEHKLVSEMILLIHDMVDHIKLHVLYYIAMCRKFIFFQ